MKISGFASGFDVDQMVKELMAAHRKPLDRLTQQKQIVEWQREEYRKINSMMIDFRINKLSQFRLSSELSAKTTQITGDASVLKAKASSSAASAALSVTVNKLATSASVRSDSSIGNNISANSNLYQLRTDGHINFTEDTFEINGVSFTIGANDTIASLVQKINSNKEANVSAFYDSGSGRLSITSNETGAGSILLSGDLLTGANAFDLNESTAGTNAELVVNGLAIERSSNTFTINGVEITLTGISGAAPTTINTVVDTDKIVGTIKAFVDEYNKLLEAVNSKLGEERYRNFMPLTDDQKKEMSEKDIELWQEKARSGMLKQDAILSSMVNEMRLAIISDVGSGEGAINLTSLGITTGNWQERGKLVIDEDRLRAAIQDDPDQIVRVFSSSGSGTDTGIFNRLSNIVRDSLNEISAKAGTSLFNTNEHYSFSANSTMATEIRTLDHRLDDMNRRLAMLEERYYKQFTAMEKAINRFNSMSGVLTNFMSN